MGDRTLRGARLGGQSFEDERGIEFAARQQVGYRCTRGHVFEITMSVEADVPAFRKVAQEKIWPAYKGQYGALWDEIEAFKA